MFNLYQTMNRHAEAKEQKEPETTGHDRFYQERVGRSSFRKKRKPVCRRAQSAAELNPTSIAAANRRAAFRGGCSVSTENESEEEGSACTTIGEKSPLVTMKIDSLAKLLFNKSIIGSPSGSQKGSPVDEDNCILREGDKSADKSPASHICMNYLENSSRYEFLSQLNDIGSRGNKHWFAIKDCSIKTERLLTLTPLSSNCPIEPTEWSRSIIIELFRALHHPYIYPVLDVAFYSGYALTIIPFNPRGSLKDLIYKTQWREEWLKKHGSSSGEVLSSANGLPLWQVGRLGRQVLEGLLFLAERGFPPFKHLHSGNVIVQNGVARISGLENTLLGVRPRAIPPIPPRSPQPEVLALGHLLFEMCAGYELDCPAPTPGHLQLDLERYPQVVDILEVIFGPRTPTLAEVVLCDLFRKIDLREMKGSCLPNFNQRLSSSCASLLGQVSRSMGGRSRIAGVPRSAGCSPVATPPPRRRHHTTTDDFESCWYD